VHSADQFLQDSTNKRTDDYGGSLEMRVALEVTDAVVSVLVRIALATTSHRGDSHGMGDSNLAATFGYLATELGKRKLRSGARARDWWSRGSGRR